MRRKLLILGGVIIALIIGLHLAQGADWAGMIRAMHGR